MKRTLKDIEVYFCIKKKGQLRVDPNDTIKSMMQILVNHYHCDFVYGYLRIDESKIKQINPEDYEKTIDSLNIVKKLVYYERIGGQPRGVLWTDYIQETSIQPYQKGLSQKPSITIIFKPFSPFGEERWTIDTKSLCYFTRENRGFQNNWTSDNYNINIFRHTMPRVLLLALKDISDLDAIRYNIFGPTNKGYYGGEYHSWQRYTNRDPCPQTFIEYSCNHIKITSLDVLDPNQWYGWVLLHTPIGNNGRPPIYEDYIIPFLPNDCSKCRNAIVAFLMIMKRKGDYMYGVGKLICREYMWKERYWN